MTLDEHADRAPLTVLPLGQGRTASVFFWLPAVCVMFGAGAAAGYGLGMGIGGWFLPYGAETLVAWLLVIVGGPLGGGAAAALKRFLYRSGPYQAGRSLPQFRLGSRRERLLMLIGGAVLGIGILAWQAVARPEAWLAAPIAVLFLIGADAGRRLRRGSEETVIETEVGTYVTQQGLTEGEAVTAACCGGRIRSEEGRPFFWLAAIAGDALILSATLDDRNIGSRLAFADIQAIGMLRKWTGSVVFVIVERGSQALTVAELARWRSGQHVAPLDFGRSLVLALDDWWRRQNR